ncbi:MAG TPA: polysaccharide biosynthesis tyrosine autokinase [Pontiella sp.]
MPMDASKIYQGGAEHIPPSFSQPGNSSGIPMGKLDSLNLPRIILQRRKTIAIGAILGLLTGLLYIKFSDPLYEAKAMLEMNIRRPRVTDNEAVIEDYSMIRDTDVIFNTRIEKFKSPAMEQLATKEYFKRYPQDDNGIGRYSLSALIRGVAWEKKPNAHIVNVSYRSENPKFAEQLVNVLSYCAGVLMMQENQELSNEAVRWLASQVEAQRKVLDEEEKQLATLREAVQLGSLQQRSEALGQSLVSISAERENLISGVASRQTVYAFLEGLKGAEINLEMLPAGLPKEEQLNDLIRQWRVANDALLLLAGRYTKLHPEYQHAKRSEVHARDRLTQFVNLSMQSVKNEIDLMTRQINQLDSRIETVNKESISLEQKLIAANQQLQWLQRKRDAADNAYQVMLRRMEEARLSADENTAYTKVIRNASVMLVRPQKLLSLAFCLVAGILGAVAFAMIQTIWEDIIVDITDLYGLNLSVLCAIPQQKNDSRGELATVGLHNRFHHLFEVFSGINALMSSEKYQHRSGMIVISSVMPREGKTVSACNLAISSAINGTKTLLIDCDLRYPQIGRIFEVDDSHPSLLEWLGNSESQLTHGQLVYPEVIENLDLITSHSLKDINPAELLGRERLKKLLDWARENYARVIIDSPPLGPVGDAQILANQADSVILVSRIGRTRRRPLKFVLERLRDIDAEVLGCIANNVPHSLSARFCGGEGYGYAFGHARAYRIYGRHGK